MFIMTGPGSPSVLSNMVVSIEQHIDLIATILTHMHSKQLKRIEAQVLSLFLLFLIVVLFLSQYFHSHSHAHEAIETYLFFSSFSSLFNIFPRPCCDHSRAHSFFTALLLLFFLILSK